MHRVVTASTRYLQLGVLGLEFGTHAEAGVLLLIRQAEVVATRADTSEITVPTRFTLYSL